MASPSYLPRGTNLNDSSRIALLYSIRNSSTPAELDALHDTVVDKHAEDTELLIALAKKEKSFREAATKATTAMRRQISTFYTVEGVEITDLEFSNMIKRQIPTNTYLVVNVRTLPEYMFSSLKQARKIELIREEWGVINVPFLNSIEAFLSSTFKRSSPYREIMDANLLTKGVLASSLIVGDRDSGRPANDGHRQRYEEQIRAAYWSGKKITITIPSDFSEDGVLEFEFSSRILKFSIDSGRWLRSVFTNN